MEATLRRRPLRGAEGDVGHTLDFTHGVDALVGGALGGASARAEVEAAGELAHDEQVHAFHRLALQRRAVGERRVHAGGAQVGVEVHCLANGEQALFRAARASVPLRAAHGAKEDGVGGEAGLAGGGGEGLTGGVDARAADGVGGEGEGVAEASGDGLQHLAGGGRDLGADAVAGEEDDAVGHGLLVQSNSFRLPRACPEDPACREHRSLGGRTTLGPRDRPEEDGEWVRPRGASKAWIAGRRFSR